MPSGSAIPVPVDQLTDAALRLTADRLAADLDTITTESRQVRSSLAQCGRRLRLSTIKLVINGFVGLLGLITAAAVIDMLVVLPLISIGIMVWDAFDYAADVVELRTLCDKAQALEIRAYEISTALAIIAAELAERSWVIGPE